MRLSKAAFISFLALSVAPWGLSSAATDPDGSVNTPPGQEVEIQPLPEMTLVFDNVVEGGSTTADRSYVNPGEDGTVTPCGNTIPSYIGLTSAGAPFVVYKVTTTAGFTDKVLVSIDHPDPSARVFHASCPPDEQGFTDVTNTALPGDPRGWVPKFSELLIGRDLRTKDQVLDAKMATFRAIIDTGAPATFYMTEYFLHTLRQFWLDTNAYRISGDDAGAIQTLNDMIQFVEDNSGSGIPNSANSPGGNAAGQLLSVGATLKFTFSND